MACTCVKCAPELYDENGVELPPKPVEDDTPQAPEDPVVTEQE